MRYDGSMRPGRRYPGLAIWLIVAAVASLALSGCRSKKKAKADLSQRWAEVEKWAKPTVPRGDATLLTRALELIEPHEHAVRNQWEEFEEQPKPPESRYPIKEPLPEGAVEAVEALVAWYEAGDGLALGDCTEPDGQSMRPALKMVDLTRAALLHADRFPDDRSPLAAVLYLGHRLRAEGKNLLHVMVGSTITDIAVRWMAWHPGLWHSAFDEYRPSGNLLIRTLAAEAVCQQQMTNRMLTNPNAAEADVLGKLPMSANMGKEFMEHEIAALRKYQIELIDGVRERLDDDTKLVDFLEAQSREAREQQRWFILRIVAPAVGTTASKLVQHRDDYRVFLELRRPR